jgi:hypothetical protein
MVILAMPALTPVNAMIPAGGRRDSRVQNYRT